MRKLLIIGLSTVVLSSCSTPMERAEDTCRHIGNPSPSCVERQFNIERARLDELRYRRQMAINAESPMYPSQQPKESEYDRRGREMEDQVKNNCESSGKVFEKYGNNSWGCGSPKVSPQPPSPQRTVVPTIGRVKMSICDRARDARARNSPAAPNLEAQCRAATQPSRQPSPPQDNEGTVIDDGIGRGDSETDPYWKQ